MRRLLLLLFALSALASAQQTSPATAPTKVAEGAYGPFDDWTLWADLPAKELRAAIDQKFAADVARTKGQPVVQKEILRMNPDFTMKGFRYEAKNFGGFEDGALDCTVNEHSLDCVSLFPGRDRGRGRINVGGGYATQFGVEIALLDMPWFFATLVAHSDRDAKNPKTLGVVSIAFDGQTPDTLVTGNPADARVQYLGQETIALLGRKVKAHKFSIDARHYGSTVWVTAGGLLLAAEWADMRMELTRYRQWKPLIPEFPVEGAAAPRQ